MINIVKRKMVCTHTEKFFQKVRQKQWVHQDIDAVVLIKIPSLQKDHADIAESAVSHPGLEFS